MTAKPSVESQKIEFISSWKVVGAVRRPIGMTKNSEWAYFVIKAAFWTSTEHILVWRKPVSRSSLENCYARPTLSKISSVLRIGAWIHLVMRFRVRELITVCSFPFNFTKYKGAPYDYRLGLSFFVHGSSEIYSFVITDSAVESWNIFLYSSLEVYSISILWFTPRFGGDPEGRSFLNTVENVLNSLASCVWRKARNFDNISSYESH